MSEVRYQIHLRRLNQIKQRANHYPVYDVKKKKFQSPKKMKIDKLTEEIKANKASISITKKELGKKKPVNYECDKYIYDREVENIQKQMVNKLIGKNKKLIGELEDLKKDLNKNYYRKKNQ